MSPCQFFLTSTLSLAHAQEVILEPAQELNMIKAAGPEHHLIWILSKSTTPSPSVLKALRGRSEAMGLIFPHSTASDRSCGWPHGRNMLFLSPNSFIQAEAVCLVPFVKEYLLSLNSSNWAFYIFGCIFHDKMLKQSDSEQKHTQMFLDVFNVRIIIWTGLHFTMVEFPQLKQELHCLLVSSGYVRLYQSSWSFIFRNLCSAERWALIFISWPHSPQGLHFCHLEVKLSLMWTPPSTVISQNFTWCLINTILWFLIN